MRIIFLVSLLLVSFFASSQNVGSLPNSILPLDTASYTLLAQPSATTLRKASLNRIFLTGKNYYDGLYRPISYVPTWSSITGKPTFTNGLTESGGGVKLGGPILESTVLTTGVDEKTEVTFDSTSVSVKAEYPTHEALNTFTYSKTSFDYSSGGTNYINEYTGWDTKKGYSLSVGNATSTMLWELDLFSGLNFDNTFGTGQFNMDANFGQFKTYQRNTTSSTTIDQNFTRVQISSDSAIFFVGDDGVYIGDNVESYKMPLNVGSNGQVLTTDGAGAATWQTPTGGYTDEQAQDAVGAMVDASLTYVDGTPLLQRAALTGAITASAGSNSTSLGSFTTSQLNTALSDNDVEVAANKATSLSTLDNTLYPTTQSLFQQRSVTGTDAIVSTDNGKTIVFNSATPFNFTIDALTAGMQMGLINKGTGTVTLVAGSGVTLGGVTSLATNESAAIIYYTSTSVDAIGGGGTALTNPMTTEGDIILAGSGGTPTRLGIGTNGYVLTSNGTTASWQAAPVVKNPSTGTVDNAVGFVSGGFGSNGTSYTVQTGVNSWGASSTGFQGISNYSAYANNTVIIAEYVILAMKSDGTAAASGTFTARFRKNNSGTWIADSGGTLSTSDATVITTAVGDINGGVPGYTWTSGAYSGTYNVGVTVKLSSHTY